MAKNNSINNDSSTLTVDNTLTVTAGNTIITAGNLVIPTTTSSVGQITQAGASIFHTYGTSNIFVGSGSGNFALTGTGATGIGWGALHSLGSSINDTAVGYTSLHSLTNGSLGENTAIGSASGANLITGQYNTLLGYNAGLSYTGTESSNICIGSSSMGVLGESNTLRIGNATGTGQGNLNAAYIQGINGVTNSSPALVTIDTSTSQLGSITYIAPTAFTPVLRFGGNNVGMTGTFVGYYSQIGKVVTINMIISLSAVGSSTGQATITGIPVAPGTGIPQTLVIGSNNYTWPAGSIPMIFVSTTSNLYYQRSGSTFGAIYNTAFANNTSLYISGSYIAA